jgi:hypothetical protein
MFITATTELEAINTMLSVLGESPVSTLDSTVGDVLVARTILRATSREVQTRGWHWNTDEKVILVPAEPSKNIVLPTTTLSVRTNPYDTSVSVTIRGSRLWNRRTNTFIFDVPLVVTFVVGLPYELLPEAARRYINIRAGRVFQERVLGSETLSAFTERDELQAWAILLDEEARTANYNMKDNVDFMIMNWR